MHTHARDCVVRSFLARGLMAADCLQTGLAITFVVAVSRVARAVAAGRGAMLSWGAERLPMLLSRRHAAYRQMALLVSALLLASIASGRPAPAVAGQSVSQSPVLYDLARDEGLGGHTLGRHVGRTDGELAERLAREPQISAASTYSDVETARRVVAAAVERSRARVEAWASRSGFRPNLVLTYVQPDGRSIGRSLARSARVATPCTRALVVLRWNDRLRRWYVLTSYPEAQR